MATESDRYLAKAHESLASAEADLAAGRFNSAANRAYYAAFQAAVAALIRDGVSPNRTWEHRFVSSEFPRRLITRRKALPAGLKGSLNGLFKLRLVADYESADVSPTRAERRLRESVDFVTKVESWIRQSQVSEAEVSYGGMKTSLRQPREFVDDVLTVISESYPQFRTEVIERGPRDFTVKIRGNDESVWDASDLTTEMTTDMLVDDDVWIVVLPLDESWRNQ